MQTHLVTVHGRNDAALLLAAVGAALVSFQAWGLGAAVAAAVAAVLVGIGRELTAPVALAASSAAGAALIHFAVAPEHFGEWWGFGVFFVVCGQVQFGWAILVRRRSTGPMFALGIVGSLLVVAVWVLSRTAGLPFGPEPGVSEAVSLPDVASVLLEVVTAGACVVALGGRELRPMRSGLVRTFSLTAVVVVTAWAVVAAGSH